MKWLKLDHKYTITGTGDEQEMTHMNCNECECNTCQYNNDCECCNCNYEHPHRNNYCCKDYRERNQTS